MYQAFVSVSSSCRRLHCFTWYKIWASYHTSAGIMGDKKISAIQKTIFIEIARSINCGCIHVLQAPYCISALCEIQRRRTAATMLDDTLETCRGYEQAPAQSSKQRESGKSTTRGSTTNTMRLTSETFVIDEVIRRLKPALKEETKIL